ncbi:MAG: PilZ domain-containing protein [Planctomycetota bacterium]
MTPDRRQTPRLSLDAPVKLRVEATGRYLPARSVNLSDAGLLVELDRRAALPVGSAVRLFVQGSADHPIARLAEMRPATVVRVGDDPHLLALRYDPPADLAASASRAA